jgi:uncharacterized protein YeaO (DUF488 family)
MITIANINQINPFDYDETWAIVRSYKKNIMGIKQVPELSPSSSLFSLYLRLKKEGSWGFNTFQEKYVPTFLKEMCSKEARNKLNELYKLDKEGKNICLVCYCPNETLCHRSIIIGLLQGVGCKTCGKDYSYYYKQYLSIK